MAVSIGQVCPHPGPGTLGSFRPPSQTPPFPTLGSGAQQPGAPRPPPSCLPSMYPGDLINLQPDCVSGAEAPLRL